MKTNLSSPLSRPGGKAWLAPSIRALVADIPHRCYAEPFCGALGAFLARETPSKVEAINDLDGELVNFFRQVARHPEEVMRHIYLVPHSREEFAWQLGRRNMTEIERAARYFSLNRASFGAKGETYGRASTQPPASLKAKLEKVAELSARLDRVYVENLDYRRFIELYDGPETLFLLDPPYTTGDAGVYAPWGAPDVQELAKILGKIKGRWIVTLDESPAVRAAFAGCKFATAVRPKALNNRPGTVAKSNLQEVIIQAA